MAAYSQSKIAVGLFALELDRRNAANGWGITSNLSHPGIAPTNLLAPQETLGRASAAPGRGLIGALSRRGILLGTPDSAGIPDLLSATSGLPSGCTGPQVWVTWVPRPRSSRSTRAAQC